MNRTVSAVLAALLPTLCGADGPSPSAPQPTGSQAYTAFGGTYPFGSISGAFQRYTFTGRETSGHSAAGAPMFYRNRQYSPGLGRFGRRDPVLGGDPSFNEYAHPNANCVRYLDPMGTEVLLFYRAPGTYSSEVYWGIQSRGSEQVTRKVKIGVMYDFHGARSALIQRVREEGIDWNANTMSSPDLPIVYEPSYGKAVVSYKSLLVAIRNFWGSYPDMSAEKTEVQDCRIKSYLDYVARGVTIKEQYIEGSIPGFFAEGMTGGLTIGLNTFSFGAYDRDAWRWGGRPSSEFQGWDYDVSRASFKVSRGALLLATGAQLSGVGQANVLSRVDLLTKFNTAPGLVYTELTATGALIGVGRWQQGGDFGDVVDTAGWAGLAAGFLNKVSGLTGSVNGNIPGGGNTVTANRAGHERSVDDFCAKAEANGYEVVGRGTSFHTPFGRRDVDVILRNKTTGEVGGIEIKSSMEAFNRFDEAARQQFAADRWINTGGAQGVGAASGEVLNYTMKIQWSPPQ